MKKFFVKTDSLVRAWDACVDQILFPPRMVELLTPEIILQNHTDNIYELRKNNKNEVDKLIAEIRAALDDEATFQVLLKSDPLIVALYYERLLRSKALLLALRRDSEIQAVIQTDELISFLLYHERVQ